MSMTPYLKKLVVIVDSLSSQVKELIRLLKENQFEVIHLENGKEALQFCRSRQPSVLVTELSIRGMDGIELLRRLKANFMTRDIPIVITTKETELEDRLKTLELGIDDYVAKPYHPEEVAARLDTIVQEVEVIEQVRHNTEHGFAGNLSEMNLVDLIQTLELGKKSGIAHLVREHNEGWVFFKDGQVIDAFLEGLQPSEALDSMLTWLDGSFQVSLHPIERVRTIHQSNREILLHGSKLIQQWRELTMQMPPLQNLYTIADNVEKEDLPEDEKALLTLFAEPKSVLQGIEESALDNLTTLRLVKSLIEKGMLVKKDATHTADSYGKFLVAKIERERIENQNIYSRILSLFKRKNRSKRNIAPLSSDRKDNDWIATKSFSFNNKKPTHRIYLSKSELLLMRQKLLTD